MRKRQKLILILYAFAVFFVGFVYVPYDRYYQNGVKEFIGHHIRAKLIPFEYPWGYINIDAPLIIAEVIAFTALAIVAFLLLKRE